MTKILMMIGTNGTIMMKGLQMNELVSKKTMRHVTTKNRMSK